MGKIKSIKVDKSEFEAMMAKLIATPASAKDGIKPKPKASKGTTQKSPRRPGSK